MPECLENGEFRQLQCEPDGETCFCVSKDGIEVPHSRNQAGQPKPNCESKLKILYLKFNFMFRNWSSSSTKDQ